MTSLTPMPIQGDPGGDVFDVIIVGAGLSGLTCGQELQRSGQRVLILEKSAGLGGRIATRRIGTDCWLDHGVPAWIAPPDFDDFPNWPQWQALTTELLTKEIIQAWPEFTPTQPSELSHFQAYAAPQGMTSIAKHLAQGLRIERQQRVTMIQVNPDPQLWQVTTVNPKEVAQAWWCKTLVLAIPAPQIHELCRPLSDHGLALEFLRHLAQVTYDPSLTVMVGFAPELRSALPALPALDPDDSQICWWAWDSQKRPQPAPPVIVLHSTPDYAQANFEAVPLADAGYYLWASVQKKYDLPDLLTAPNWLQVHRWRYAQITQGYPRPYLIAPLSPTLICCGDWCGQTNPAWGLGRAWASGMETAKLLTHPLA
ncbi:NAD(P)/FAD-dependent oxidoreductase [Synechococcus sp. PCC 6312]|uniref:NAD(P)/FAD-dependent oxidoreductase n=1 Tax=Synechococcus sp. (strain ATCC 27167 / PCC 6312) TaxID=195253 RepID=UPI00029EFBA7|nr:FAD-dependent oxidoreductase [Synechococcus sp. PCC 6312]AFY62400.1 putative NAD/FAD-dependent oxidoreductase [Synechococcus sp. PCC 6312]